MSDGSRRVGAPAAEGVETRDGSETASGAGDAAPTAAGPLTASRRSRRARVVRIAFVVAVAVALGALLWQQRTEVADAAASLPAGALLAALGLALVGTALPGLAWRELVNAQSASMGLVAGLRVFFYSQLGKYLPGGIWNYVAQIDLARDLKVPARQAALASLLALAVSVITALVVAGVTVPFALPGLLGTYWWTFLAVPVLLSLLVPRSVTWWSGLAFRLLRRDHEPVRLSWPPLLRAAAVMVLSWIAFGLHFAVLVGGLGAEDAALVPLSIGGFALAWVAGFLVLIAPAGAGVREAALVLCFLPVLPAGAVLAMALLSRVLLVVADVLLAGIFVLLQAAARGRRGSARAGAIESR
jgi:glycosyltransferase 2 family protein